MTKPVESVVKKIVSDKLSDYVEVREAETAKPTAARKTATYKAPAARRVTSYDEYAKRTPAIRTPSVFSKAKVDEKLLRMQELPTPDKPIKNYAGYSREEWDFVLDEASGYLADVLEGAGLVYKGGFSVSHFRKGLSILLQESFKHRDPFDKRNRFISVDGRIDTDERKP